MSETRPLVSVLMTAYNRADLIGNAIESVLAQTLTDFELIVVDDRSTDGTVEVARGFLSDPRVRVVCNDRNLGDYANRNYAVTLVRGEFFKYHDSDDVMYPHGLDVMVRSLAAEPSAAFALSGPRSWSGGPSPMLLTPKLAYEREFLGTGLFHLGPAAALFRTKAFRDLGGFVDAKQASDYMFWAKACARVNVLLTCGDLFYYRVHTGQEVVKPESDIEYAKAAGFVWRMLNGPECPLEGAALNRARRNFVYTQARGIYRHLRRKRFASARAIATEVGITPGEWMRYLGRPHRTNGAGTPRTHNGQTA